jgi:hypothetical protein
MDNIEDKEFIKKAIRDFYMRLLDIDFQYPNKTIDKIEETFS